MNALAILALAAPAADPSAPRRIRGWIGRQPAAVRACAISALARAYLGSRMHAAALGDALLAMTAALDDPAACVRRALAEALASAAGAPRHLIAALALDLPEIACPVLSHAQWLPDPLLAEAATRGTAQQVSIARRADLGRRTLQTLADCGSREATFVLLGNPYAKIEAAAFRRIFDRFAEDAGAREALAARDDLPADVRADLAIANAGALVAFGRSRGWLDAARAERLRGEAVERALVEIARACEPQDLRTLVQHLNRRGLLTPALLTRGLLSGDFSLFEASLALLTGAPRRRVAGFVADWRGRGFEALFEKSGLPEAFLPAFRATIAEAMEAGSGEAGSALAALRRCEDPREAELEPALAILWRLAGEAAPDVQELAPEPFPGAEAMAETAPEPQEPPAAFDIETAIERELEIVVAELAETREDLGQPGAEGQGEEPSPVLPPAFDFATANRNDTSPIPEAA